MKSKNYIITFEKFINSKIEDCKDILIELEDEGWRVRFSEDKAGEIKKRILVRDNTDRLGKPWSDIKDYILRLKSVLGEDFISFKWRGNKFTDGGRMYEMLDDINEDTQIEGLIWAFGIEFKI